MYFYKKAIVLTLIWMEFLGVPFKARNGVRVDLPPCLKLVKIMLETLNVTRKYTHMQFWKLYLLVPRLSFFFKKNPSIFGQK